MTASQALSQLSYSPVLVEGGSPRGRRNLPRDSPDGETFGRKNEPPFWKIPASVVAVARVRICLSRSLCRIRSSAFAFFGWCGRLTLGSSDDWFFVTSRRKQENPARQEEPQTQEREPQGRVRFVRIEGRFLSFCGRACAHAENAYQASS